MEDLQSLLDKINRDGVEKADAKAAEIIAAAKAKADALMKDARAEAERTRTEAQSAAAEYAKRAETSIRQAARDLVLETQGRITSLFERLLAEGVDHALADEASITALVSTAVRDLVESGDIRVSAKLLDTLRATLAAKGGFTVTADDTIRSGFTVRIDGGRVEHTFTGEVIAAELAKRLRPDLAALMN